MSNMIEAVNIRMDELRQKHLAENPWAAIPRTAAAHINPLIDGHTWRGTVSNVAEDIMHLADTIAQSRAAGEVPPDVYRLFDALAAALRYEADSAAFMRGA